MPSLIRYLTAIFISASVIAPSSAITSQATGHRAIRSPNANPLTTST